MAMDTVIIVQTFTLKGRRLIADQPSRVKTPEEAIRKAERAAPNKAGVVAFVQQVDADTDEVDEAVKIIFRAGQLPQAFAED